jgi:hypothetical protein
MNTTVLPIKFCSVGGPALMLLYFCIHVKLNNFYIYVRDNIEFSVLKHHYMMIYEGMDIQFSEFLSTTWR